MENNNDAELLKKNKIFSYLLFVFFVSFLASGVFLLLNQKKNKNSNNINISANQITNTDNLNTVKKNSIIIHDNSDNTNNYSFFLKTESIDIKPGGIVNVDVYSDSNSKNIVGYDVVLKYNPLAFDFLKLEPIVSDIRVYNYRKDSYLTLTGVRNLQSNPTPFVNTKLVSLYFEAKKIGSFDFSLVRSLNTNKTDLITDNTEVLIPSLNNLEIEVK